MKYPAREEFLERFGLEPFKVDPEIGLFVYREGSEGQVEVEFSFSLVMRSFQVSIFIGGVEVSVISSEGVDSISIFEYAGRSGLRIEFISELGLSKAELVLEPTIHLVWSRLV
ncbi:MULTISPECIES: hypothetical protein [Stenotrophomonas]|uniref:Glyco_hydro38C2 domain-containing protein n=2 Tax=cellular organisms TaxID=131567 RepID=A0A0R3QJ09_9BILA|nr:MULTISPECIES: hypothetical protein [Stenotrophomonas]PJL33816.1 hypothetical protein B9Y64_01600 [Stenotrophomonas maltophilia]VDO18316.1 unnamed protein product [Brugia timori]HDS1147625.1 hypothetical protein [Stenotrophomonas maltophilia]HDS1159224.1 hypothetical protein [Stenotrophomonas maltophilia]